MNPETWKQKEAAKSRVTDKKVDEDMKHDIVDNITKETFVVENMMMGCTKPEAEAKWEGALMDEANGKEWHEGSRQCHLQKFRGCRAATGSRSAKEQAVSREHGTDDAGDFKAAEDSRKAAAASSGSWLKKAKAA